MLCWCVPCRSRRSSKHKLPLRRHAKANLDPPASFPCCRVRASAPGKPSQRQARAGLCFCVRSLYSRRNSKAVELTDFQTTRTFPSEADGQALEQLHCLSWCRRQARRGPHLGQQAQRLQVLQDVARLVGHQQQVQALRRGDGVSFGFGLGAGGRQAHKANWMGETLLSGSGAAQAGAGCNAEQ